MDKNFPQEPISMNFLWESLLRSHGRFHGMENKMGSRDEYKEAIPSLDSLGSIFLPILF